MHVASDQVTLRHPLLRRVLIDSTPLAVRLTTYRALADLAGPDLRAWYLSHATVGPDREVADRLAEAAEDTRRRSGYSAALRLSKRAAELTADNAKRADRLLVAATDAQLAGDARSAADWCEEALYLRTDPPFTAAATLIQGRALTWVGEPGHGYEAVIRAAANTRSAGSVSRRGTVRRGHHARGDDRRRPCRRERGCGLRGRVCGWGHAVLPDVGHGR